MRRTALAAVAALTLLSSASVARAGAAPGRLDAFLAASSAALGLAPVRRSALDAAREGDGRRLPGTATEWDDLRSGINAALHGRRPAQRGGRLRRLARVERGRQRRRLGRRRARRGDQGAPGRVRDRAPALGAAIRRGGGRAARRTNGSRPPLRRRRGNPARDPALRAVDRCYVALTRSHRADDRPVDDPNRVVRLSPRRRLRATVQLPRATTPGRDVAGTVTNAAVDVPDAAAHLARPVSHPDGFSIAGARRRVRVPPGGESRVRRCDDRRQRPVPLDLRHRRSERARRRRGQGPRTAKRRQRADRRRRRGDRGREVCDRNGADHRRRDLDEPNLCRHARARRVRRERRAARGRTDRLRSARTFRHDVRLPERAHHVAPAGCARLPHADRRGRGAVHVRRHDPGRAVRDR